VGALRMALASDIPVAPSFGSGFGSVATARKAVRPITLMGVAALSTMTFALLMYWLLR
jgi:2-methylisocitrate lyase-like PEP mutase family enzyme